MSDKLEKPITEDLIGILTCDHEFSICVSENESYWICPKCNEIYLKKPY